MTELRSAYLIEAAWEVCNKVGGIHTVITSKLSHATSTFGDRYLLVGPWLGEQQRAVFREETAPSDMAGALKALEKRGVTAHYGTWLLPEEPKALLIAWDGMIGELNSIKADLWERFKLDTLGTNFYDVDQPLLWSTAVGAFAQSYAASAPNQVILHAHEWMTGAAVLTATHENLATVFTTHATVLGRALSSQDIFIYDKLGVFKPEDEAHRLNVLAKHQIERLSAQNATVFTTVSDITATEAAAFLGRQAEVVTENGIDSTHIATYDELAISRTKMRHVLDDFIAAYFFPSYRFDITKTRYQFTMGRNEVHNKGDDLYIESLRALDEKMRAEKSDQTVVAFILVPADALRLRPEVALQMTVARQMDEVLHQYSATLPRTLYTNYLEHSTKPLELPAELIEHLEELRSRLPHINQPAVSPYDMRTGEDTMLRLARENGLVNSAENRVKIVYLPIYIDGFDGIFNLPLYTIISGCDLGVFPSLYEPWGYTPMESMMMGVPAITSTVAGFGQAISRDKLENAGVSVLNRSKNNHDTELAALTKLIDADRSTSSQQMSVRRFNAYQTALHFGWDRLYARYIEVYSQL